MKARTTQFASRSATLQAPKNVDAYGLFPGNNQEKPDGEQAIQAPLGGRKDEAETWARLPREMWPSHVSSRQDSVVPVIKAIYGHTQPGRHWA